MSRFACTAIRRCRAWVILDHELMGYRAAELLDRMMKGKKHAKKPILIQPRGVISRRSTDVARHCGISRRTMERTFAQYLGMSPHDQIVRTKVARAKQLLAETDYAMDTIAAESGLSHAAYLNVLFKREVGLTPGEFRKRAHQGAEGK